MFVRVKVILISAIEAGGIVKRFRYAEEVAGASSVEMWEWVTDRSRQVAPRESSPISSIDIRRGSQPRAQAQRQPRTRSGSLRRPGEQRHPLPHPTQHPLGTPKAPTGHPSLAHTQKKAKHACKFRPSEYDSLPISYGASTVCVCVRRGRRSGVACVFMHRVIMRNHSDGSSSQHKLRFSRRRRR